MALVIKNPSVNLRDRNVRKTGLIPAWGRFPGRGLGNPLQYSCLDNPIDRGAWRATVHEVARSRIRLKHRSSSSSVGEDMESQKLSYTGNGDVDSNSTITLKSIRL